MIPEVISGVVADLAAKAVSGLVGPGQKRPALSSEVRYRVYRDFRHAVLRALLSLDLWTVARPGFVGAVWSWPVALSSYRANLRNMREMVVQFSEIVCVGTPQISESAVKVTEALMAMNQQIRTATWRERKRTPVQLSGYADQRRELLAAVREFMVLSTADLGRSRPPRAASPTKGKE